jgi:hypothetical protein
MRVRTDIHSPKSIDPANYEFVGCAYGRDDMGDFGYVATEIEAIKAHMAKTGGHYATHDHGGTCYSCGARAVYMACLYHAATNEYILTGEECANKIDHGVLERFRKCVKTARFHKAGQRKAKALLDDANLSAAYTIWETKWVAGERFEEATIRSIVGRLVEKGYSSDKSLNYVGDLLGRIEKRAVEAPKAAPKALVPVVSDRIAVAGKIISIKPDQEWGGHKMTVRTDFGWAVNGKLPASLASEGVEIGDAVTFMAGLVRSSRDPSFGFFSRPSKAKVLAKKGA